MCSANTPPISEPGAYRGKRDRIPECEGSPGNSRSATWRLQDQASLYAAMLGEDERANRLRQSAPYVGLLPREDVERLNRDEAAA